MANCERCEVAVGLSDADLIATFERSEDEHAHAFLLLPYVRAGRFEEAGRAHLRGYRMLHDPAAHPILLAQHLLFCALTGNLSRAVAIAERHIQHLTGQLAELSVVFGRAVDAGYGAAPLRIPMDVAFSLGLTSPITIASLSAAISETRAELRAVHYEVPLSVLPSARPSAPSCDFGLPGTAEGWLEWCDQLVELHNYESAYHAVGKALALDPEPALRAEALGYRVRLLSELERREEIPSLIAERAALLRDLGEEVHACWLERSAELAVQPLTGEEVGLAETLVSEYDRPEMPLRIRALPRLLLGHVLLHALRTKEAISQLQTGVEHARAGGAHRMADSAVYALAHALTLTGEYQAAERVLRATLARSELRPAARPRLQLLLSQVLAVSGQMDLAAVTVAEAIEHFASLPGSSGWVGHASTLEVTYLAELGDVVAAVERLRWTIQRAWHAEWDRTAHWSLQCRLGSLLIMAHRLDEAVEVLHRLIEEIDAVAGVTGVEETDLAEITGEAWYWLGVASRQLGDRRAALDYWSKGLELMRDFPDAHAETARLHFAIAELWHSEENFPLAITAYLESLARVEQTRDPVATAQVRRSLGLARCESGDPLGLDDLAEAREVASRLDAPVLLAELEDVTARSLAELKRFTEAVSSALQAADAYRKIGDDVRAGLAELMAAKVVAEQGQTAEAISLLRAAIEATLAAGAGAHTVDSFLLLAELLDNCGEHAEARVVRLEAERRAI
jgi:tetratricopeptide (TPR) repeat protein